jgi:[NiFe] hydrogenase diaphorase moiety large subunit
MQDKNHTSILFAKVDLYEGLKKALEMKRVEIISEVRESGLRGRGGAGFPTGTKWNLAATAQDSEKYVVCNADEGEPGTFKDRILLTECTDIVLDGMTIGGLAIGAKVGIIYLRGEYEYMRKSIEARIQARKDCGMLGKNVGGRSGFDFDIRIQMGAGAYVCGEETALIESLEGHRGEPRNRPPFPVNTGYLGHPTAVNNVETFALVARLMEMGALRFAGIGTQGSSGTKLFSVSGDCQKPGVYEFPMGITVHDLLEKVGAERTKAIQVGGASGQCVPIKDKNRKLSFDDLSTGGSIIVFNEDRDMLRVAINFMEFFDEESCGQCTPCRDGNKRLLLGLEKIKAGKCSLQYLDELKALSETMQLSSKCGLGQSSPNAFLSIVEHFQEEIMACEPV